MSKAFETFDGDLGISNLGIFFKIYCIEKKSKESREQYEQFLKINYPNEYADFLNFKRKVKNKTPNIKELIFDWIDGKRDIPDFKMFEVYND